jgi:hypothetical protein
MEDQMMANGRAAELSKVKKSTNYLNEELTSVKSQQGELEKIGKMIYAQNSQLLNENKLLWEELNKNKEKYEKKVEKLMKFVYSVMNGNEAIAGLPDKKMLPASENTDPNKPNHTSSESTAHSPESQQKNDTVTSPEQKSADMSAPKIPFADMNAKPISPPLYSTPTNSHISGISTLPNTPGLAGIPPINNMMGAPMMANFANYANPNIQTMPMIPNTYNAQPYFTENPTNSPPNTATTSGNMFRNTKLTRPVPQMDASESKEFNENPVKLLKKEPDTSAATLQANNLPSETAYGDPLKLEEWPFAFNLSRGASYNNNDLNMSRLNSFNLNRVPSTLEPNYAQFGPMYVQNLRSNGDNMSFNPGKLESEGMGKMDMVNEDGVPCFSPSAFMRNPSGVGAFNFGGNNGEDALYTK